MRKYLVDNITIQGYAHILAEKACQDHSVSWQNKYYDAAIVCDGHGGDKYIRSDTGSYLACEAGKKVISVFMEHLAADKDFRSKFFSSEKSRDEMFEQLTKAIIQEWNWAVESDYSGWAISDDPRFISLTDAEKQDILRENSKAYGSTFIAAVLSDGFYFILKLGDGNACILREEAVEFAEDRSKTLRDEQLQFNLTTSLCSGVADREFRYAFVKFPKNSVQGIALTTDGVINSYTSEEGYIHLIGNVFSSYREADIKTAHDELENFLHTLSEKGSGDDLSVAVICHKK